MSLCRCLGLNRVEDKTSCCVGFQDKATTPVQNWRGNGVEYFAKLDRSRCRAIWGVIKSGMHCTWDERR